MWSKKAAALNLAKAGFTEMRRRSRYPGNRTEGWGAFMLAFQMVGAGFIVLFFAVLVSGKLPVRSR
jgi:hypothetical protein